MDNLNRLGFIGIFLQLGLILMYIADKLFKFYIMTKKYLLKNEFSHFFEI